VPEAVSSPNPKVLVTFHVVITEEQLYVIKNLSCCKPSVRQNSKEETLRVVSFIVS